MKLKPLIIIIAITAFFFITCSRGSETNTTVTELPAELPAQLPAETSVVTETINERTEQVPANYTDEDLSGTTMYQNYIGRWVEDPAYPQNGHYLEINHIYVEQNEIEFVWYRYRLGEYRSTAKIENGKIIFNITNDGHPDIIWHTTGTLDFLENRILLTIISNDFPHFEDPGTTFHYWRQ